MTSTPPPPAAPHSESSGTTIWTVKHLLEWTTSHFAKKSMDTPRLEAEILLAAAMDCKRIDLYTQFDTEPSETKRTVFREFVKRRAQGEPVAYIVGYREFFSLKFYVNSHVLIPRPETEQLVVETLDVLKSRYTTTVDIGPIAVCDVGTGSGAIAVAVAKHWPKPPKHGTPPETCGIITAVDISADSLAVAQKNAAENQVGEMIQWLESDLFTAVSESEQFDIIVSNPPYISQQEYESLSLTVRSYEPKTALLAGPMGTEVYERLISQAVTRLKSGGTLLLETSPMMVQHITVLLKPPIWKDTTVLNDLAGLPRVIRCVRS